MIALITISPTLIGCILMFGSVKLGRPIAFEKISWLFTYAQMLTIIIGFAAIVSSKNSEKAMPKWRILANKWVGWCIAATCLFYVFASILTAHRGP
jgi:hypothetical protein